MSRGIVILLCNLTLHAAQPWLDGGYEVVMVDMQHPAGSHRDGNVVRIGATILGSIPHLIPFIRSGRVVLVVSFPPCTDMAGSGTPQWARKFKADRYFQHKAALIAEQCRTVSLMCDCPWVMENPTGILSSIMGAPQYRFDPHEYTLVEPDDNYWKGTCLWAGNGFRMPAKQQRQEIADSIALARIALGNTRRTRRNTLQMMAGHADYEQVAAFYPDDRIHTMSPGARRGDKRSESPRGFCRAMYEANAPHLRAPHLALEAA